MLEEIKEINSFIEVENYTLNSPEAEKYEVTENGTMVILNEDRENKGGFCCKKLKKLKLSKLISNFYRIYATTPIIFLTKLN